MTGGIELSAHENSNKNKNKKKKRAELYLFMFFFLQNKQIIPIDQIELYIFINLNGSFRSYLILIKARVSYFIKYRKI